MGLLELGWWMVVRLVWVDEDMMLASRVIVCGGMYQLGRVDMQVIAGGRTNR